MFIKRKELINIMRSCGSSEMEKQFQHLYDEIKRRSKCDSKQQKETLKKLSYFKTQYKTRYTKARRMEERFKSNNQEWLEGSILFPNEIVNKRGRPELSFNDSSERTKRLKTKELRNTTPASVLSYATRMSLRSEGQVQASKLLSEITTSPHRATKYIKAYAASLDSKPKSLSGEDALAVLITAKLSRYQYEIVRNNAPQTFPSYKTIQSAKKFCYPNNIHITDTSASVPLQDLLDHTAQRLILSIEPVIRTLRESELTKLCLFTKWGFDGSSGHSSYKQAFHGTEASDSAVFITCVVPVRLVSDNKIIWQNPSPASTAYCRPLKIQFIKESKETSIVEKNRVDHEIEKLRDTTITSQDRQVHVNHKLIFTMVDGKVCNALTETTSTQKCFICGATSKMFNNIEVMIARPINTDNLGFGLSVLHGWIRMFECVLHLAYKLPIMKWQVRGADKQIVEENKARIQKEFREKCGLIVDMPKPGFGSTNDGNTARRFFKNAELSAEITKIDLELIKKLHTVMRVVASGYEIDVEKFRIFTHHTAMYFTEKYPWYNMSPTVHKYLIHGPEIVSAALLPIGQLSEEAQEARNKDFKRYREHNSRKCSRVKTNEDVFNLFLISSDPLISSKRKIKRKNLRQLPTEVISMLKAPTVAESDNSDTETEEVNIADSADDSSDSDVSDF